MNRPRVLLADDHTLVAEGLCKLLEPVAEVVGTVADGRALLQRAAELRPDVVVVDISMPLLNGLEAARELKKKAPELKIIVLTQHTDVQYAEAAFRAGATGYVVKSCAGDELTTAIREVCQGRMYVTPVVAKDVLEFFLERVPDSRPTEKLTTRQREVLQLIAEGQSTKQVAATLHVSPKTAEFHRYNIMRELDLHSAAELTRYAIQHGIAPLG